MLVSKRGVGCIYEVLNWMSGDNLFTHQLPRVSREAEAAAVAFNPALRQAVEDAKQITPANAVLWRERWFERYGETITLPRMTEDQHERKDSHSELAEKVHPDKIAVVDPKEIGL